MKHALVIDSNERGPLPDAVERWAASSTYNPPIPIARDELMVGDYICGDWYIESKTVGDFIESIQSGHLGRQLDNLDANVDKFGIVVWGSISDYVKECAIRGSKMSISLATKMVVGGLARITTDFDCLAFRAADLTEAAYFLTALHHKTYKPASRHGTMTIKKVSTKDVRLDMLLTIPGIGMNVAESILEKCGSLEEAACQDCLKQVPKMGKILRNRVVEALTSEKPMRVERQKTS